MCLHQAILEPRVAFREFKAKAPCEGLGYGLGGSDMVPVVVGVFATVSTSSSRHVDDILRQKVRIGVVVREENSKSDAVVRTLMDGVNTMVSSASSTQLPRLRVGSLAKSDGTGKQRWPGTEHQHTV